jgi:branched-chain amino acid transport system substrate-binding protein
MGNSLILKPLLCLKGILRCRGLVAAAALVLATGCGDDSESGPAAAEGDSIKLGLLTTLSGGLEREGSSWRAAVEMAVAEINAAGGVLGQEVELLIADTGTDPERAEAAAAGLRDRGVVAFIGPIISSSTLRVAAQVAVPASLPLISPASTAGEISGLADADLVWRTAVSDVFKGKIVARYAHDTGSRRAAVLFLDNSFGRGLADEFSVAFTELGGQVVSRVSFPELSGAQIEEFDYRPNVDEAMREEPDLLYVISLTEDGVKIVIAADANVSAEYQPRLVSEMSPDESLLSVIGVFEGLLGIEQKAFDSPGRTAFVENYRRLYDSEPAQFAGATYDAVYLWALAAQQAGVTAGEGVVAQLQAVSSGGTVVHAGQFGEALRLLASGADIDYEGASGSIDFDAKGDVASGTFRVWQVENGAYIDVGNIRFP